MFLGHTNLKIWESVGLMLLYLNYAESLNQEKKHLKVEILHKLKEFWKNYIWFLRLFRLKFVSFPKYIILMNNSELKCQIA